MSNIYHCPVCGETFIEPQFSLPSWLADWEPQNEAETDQRESAIAAERDTFNTESDAAWAEWQAHFPCRKIDDMEDVTDLHEEHESGGITHRLSSYDQGAWCGKDSRCRICYPDGQ